MHALHGTGAAGEEFDDDLAQEYDGLGDLTEDEMLELDVDVDGQVRVMPLMVLWHADEGGASVCVPAWATTVGQA